MHEYLARRAELIASARPGGTSARLLSTLTDQAVAEVVSRAAADQSVRFAVLATGGWGSGSLLPGSDLDLLVLSDASRVKLEPVVESILYPLWDCGLTIGHQVRSPKEQLRAMREDLSTLTAALTARTLAGHTAWADQVLDRQVMSLARGRRALIAQLAERPRPGTPWDLVVDLKNGRGGRRDFDELTWLAALMTGQRTADCAPLVSAELMSAADYLALLGAADDICALRWRAHRLGDTDVLTPEVASESGRDSCERFHDAAVHTEQSLDAVRSRIARQLRRRWWQPARPSTPLAAQTGDSRSQSLSADALFDLLDRGPEAASTLATLAHDGALDGLLSDYRPAMRARRPGLGHRYTVGYHCIRAATALPGLCEPRLAKSTDALADLRAVQIAALIHDVGKLGDLPGHAQLGARPAYEAAIAVGLTEGQARLTARLVELHLLLVETALSQDLDDEDTIIGCAAEIGTLECLYSLHLLTAADSISTGEATWSAWTARLVESLVSRVEVALQPGSDAIEVASASESTRARAWALAANPEESALISRLPLRYLASRSPAVVAAEAKLIRETRERRGGRTTALHVGTGPIESTATITVIGRDRPEFLARTAGVLSLAGLDIMSLDAYPVSDGLVLDTFVVRAYTDAALTPDVFFRVERLLEAALSGGLSLAARLAEKRRHYPAPHPMPALVETRVAHTGTEMSVTARNRPGLLFDIASALAAQGLTVMWAKGNTVDQVATDVFRVVGPDGGPVDNPGVLGHLSMDIRQRATC